MVVEGYDRFKIDSIVWKFIHGIRAGGDVVGFKIDSIVWKFRYAGILELASMKL